MSLQVKVHLRWPWQKDTFLSEGGEIGVNINQGVLMITHTEKDEITSYSPGNWRRVTSKAISTHKH